MDGARSLCGSPLAISSSAASTAGTPKCVLQRWPAMSTNDNEGGNGSCDTYVVKRVSQLCDDMHSLVHSEKYWACLFCATGKPVVFSDSFLHDTHT